MFNRTAPNYFNTYQPIQPTMNPYQNGIYPPYMAAQNGQAPMPPQEPPITEVRFLTSDEMKAFIVMPNTKALLIDKDHGVACIKSADVMGQSVSKMYSFTSVTENKAEEQKETATILPTYEKEIKDLLARVEKLENARSGKAKGNPEN